MEEYIVLYEAFDGIQESFGTFNTIDKAIKWMNDDYVYCAENAGYKIKFPFENEETYLNLEDYGSWKVLKVHSI